MINTGYSFGARVEIGSYDLEEVDRHQTDLQARIMRLFPDARDFAWKLTAWPETRGRFLHVSWVSGTVPWSHRCRFSCPLHEGGGMI